LGAACPETDVDKADLETMIGASQDVAHEIRRRADLAGDDLAPSIAEFVETHAGPPRQLSLRLI